MREALLNKFFLKSADRYRVLLVFPMLNLLMLSIGLLFLKAPKEAILLSMASISLIIYLIGSKKIVFLFYLSSLLFNVLIFLITCKNESLWGNVWSLSLMVTLTIGFFLSGEVLDYYDNLDEKIKSLKNEQALWKNRFETLRDTHNIELINYEEDAIKLRRSL